MDVFDRVVQAIMAVEGLPPNYGIAIITWDQTTGSIESESNLPEEYVAALLTSWLERLPPPAAMDFFEKKLS